MAGLTVKVLLCNCRGECPSFHTADVNRLLPQLESELGVDYAILHPYLCGHAGRKVLQDLLAGIAASPEAKDTFVFSGSCSVEEQWTLLGPAVRRAGFPENQFVPVDMRGAGNQEILDRFAAQIAAIAAERAYSPQQELVP